MSIRRVVTGHDTGARCSPFLSAFAGGREFESQRPAVLLGGSPRLPIDHLEDM